jgi:UDP-N-acetylmuramate dehydrogenase
MKEFSSVGACELTTMHCGGTIAVVYEPETKEELYGLITGLDTFVVIGGGSNMIFPDGLITTAVIRLGKAFASVSMQGGDLSAGGSAPLKALLQYCLRNTLSGLEFLAGIPGTVGGALCMNAGTPDKGIMDAVKDVEFIDRQGIHVADGKAIPYRYRCGGLDPSAVITSARFHVHPCTTEEIASAIESFLARKKNQPGGFNCGSMFKNPPGSAAGYLIEQAGLKGFRIGGAKISEIHANFIINDGTATTADIKSLLGTIKERVKERFGVDLQEEVKILDERL